MSNSKSSGPSIEPCGTLCLTLSQSELFLEFSFFYYYSLVSVI